MKQQDIKELVDKNFMFLTLLGYATAILCECESKFDLSDTMIKQVKYFKTAIENIVYKNIPPPGAP